MLKPKILKTCFLILNSCIGLSASAQQAVLPESAYNLVLKAPVIAWDEALPLGNGLMGGLLWGRITPSNSL